MMVSRGKSFQCAQPLAGFGTIVLLLFALSGCDSVMPEMQPFGAVKGTDATRSANGLQVHRKMWEGSGVKCLFPSKLSPRLDTVDTIVLVGQTFQPPGKQAREWLEEWLTRGANRTVIYFGRDFNAEVYYRNRTLASVPPEKQRRARVVAAKTQTTELSQRMQQLGESTFCRWFYYDISTPRAEYSASEMAGPWAEEVAGLEGVWPVGVTLREPVLDWKKQLPSWLLPGATNNNGFQPVPTFGQAPVNPNTDTVFSRWDLQELDSQQAWDEEFEDLLQPEVLLAGKDGRPLVYSLTGKRQNNSRILVVANGAPFLNASLVDPLHRKVGERIVGSCLPVDRVAILAFDYRGLTISKILEEEKGITGMEVLTTWPLSAVTIPMVILGIVVCSVLIRRLGRAQNLPQPSRSDFGLHVETLGEMLQKSGDEVFAVNAVREYFVKVRNEKPPGWLEQRLAAALDASGARAINDAAPVVGQSPAQIPQSEPPKEDSSASSGNSPGSGASEQQVDVWGGLDVEAGKATGESSDSVDSDSPDSSTSKNKDSET